MSSTTAAAAWPPGFLLEVQRTFAQFHRLKMTDETRAQFATALKDHIAHYRDRLGLLGSHVQLAGTGVSETIGVPDRAWHFVIVDGIDRPSMTITAGP